MSAVIVKRKAPAMEEVVATVVAEVAELSSQPEEKHVYRLDEVMERLDSWLAEGKEIRKMVKAAIIGAKKRLSPEEKAAAEAKKASRPISEKAAAWNAYVDEVFAELKAADPKAKRPQAMALAKERRAAGLAPIAPVDAMSKGSKMSDEEKAEKKAQKEAEKAAKAEVAAAAKAAKADAKAETKAQKKAEKAAKAEAAAAEKQLKAEEKAAAKAAKEEAAAAAKAAKGSKGKKVVAVTKPSVASASAAAAAPAPMAAPVQEEEETLAVFKHKGKEYLRTSQNECWERDAKGGMGKWAGLYDPATDAIKAAPEPEFE